MVALLRSHFASAVLGGLVVAGGLLVFGAAGNNRTVTVYDEAPVSIAQPADSTGLTAHDIYQRYAPSVVYVQAKLVDQVDSPFDLFHDRGSPDSTGSGFVVDRHGDLLTNYHLVAGADRTSGVTVRFENNAVRPASVIAVDPSDDLAVLRVDPRRMPTVLPLRLADSTSVRVGDPTLAIGNPFGVDRTLSSGIVSALQHEIQAVDGQTIDNVIQTDQPLESGNSGGPLLNAQGRVIGVNSQVATASSQRVAFAIPIDTAYEVLSRVAHEQTLRLAYLGVAAPRRGSARLNAGVGSVDANGPAAQAGIRPGDVIQRVAGIPVDSISDVQAVVSTFSPRQLVQVELMRGHKRHVIPVVLGARKVPTTPDR